jgi:histidinol-phosphatase (PHP family)
MQKFNFHTHSLYCDGKSGIEENIISAINKGLVAIGFSSHAPLPFPNDYSLDFDQLQNYICELEDLKQKYHQQIQIYKSLEIDFIPGVSFPFDAFKKQGLDYTIGGVHLVQHPDTKKRWFIDGGKQNVYDEGLKEIFDNDIRKAVTVFYQQSIQMIEQEKPDIIAHFDKIKMHNKGRYFSEDDKWYQNLVFGLLQIIKENNTVIELNTRGLYKGRSNDWFPAQRWLKHIRRMKIPVTISSDAHHPDELDKYFDLTCKMLRENEMMEIVVFSNGQWQQKNLFHSYL